MRASYDAFRSSINIKWEVKRMGNEDMDFKEVPIGEHVADEVNPGRRAMNRVLIGLALSTFTLNFLLLNYILPALGIVLMLLGFRSLRRENREFKVCWILSIIRVPYIFAWFIINASIWQKTILESAIAKSIAHINIVIIFAQIILMERGFRSVQEKAGIKPHTGSITAFLIWYILLYILGLLQYNGFIMPIVLIIVFILIIRGLKRLISELNDTGYVIDEVPAGISDRAVIIGFSLVLTLGIAVMYIFFSKYPMQWIPVAVVSNNEAQAVKDHLVSLGFPDIMVDDLTEEDLLDCADAVRVIVQEDGNADPNPDLRITDVAVKLPGSRETWRIFHYFQWNRGVPFRGTDVIEICPKYRKGYGWIMEGEISGQVLYDEADHTYAAPYYRIIDKIYEQDNIFGSGGISQNTFAEFSFPKGKGNYRGYVSYKIQETGDGLPFEDLVIYVFQKSWLQYPVQTAMDYSLTSSRFPSSDVFRLLLNSLRFAPDKENYWLIDNSIN